MNDPYYMNIKVNNQKIKLLKLQISSIIRFSSIYNYYPAQYNQLLAKLYHQVILYWLDEKDNELYEKLQAESLYIEQKYQYKEENDKIVELQEVIQYNDYWNNIGNSILSKEEQDEIDLNQEKK